MSDKILAEKAAVAGTKENYAEQFGDKLVLPALLAAGGAYGLTADLAVTAQGMRPKADTATTQPAAGTIRTTTSTMMTRSHRLDRGARFSRQCSRKAQCPPAIQSALVANHQR